MRAKTRVNQPRQESDHRSLRSTRPHIARGGAPCATRGAPKGFGVDASFDIPLIGPLFSYSYSCSQICSDNRCSRVHASDAARAFFNSRTMEKRFSATRREGVETLMYA